MKGVDGDLSVEGGRSEDIGVSRVEGGLEGPVVARRKLRREKGKRSAQFRGRRWGEQGKQAHLSEDLRALRVPQDRSVVLSTGEKKIGILLTPRDGENTLVVTGEDLEEGEKETVSSSS